MRFWVFFLSLFMCINLSHSQTPTIPSIPSLSNIPIQPPPPTPIPGNSSTTMAPPNNPLNQLLNSIQLPNPAAPDSPPGPKYKEFLSICRTNDFDSIFYLSDALKEKRIKLIEEKIKLEPAKVKLKLRLLKEFVDQRKVKDAEQLVLVIKATRATEDEVTLASGMVAYLKKDRKKAREYLNKILSSQPKNVDALKWLADEYKAELNYFEAQAIYEDMAKIPGENTTEGICEVLTLDAHYVEAEPVCLKGSSQKKDPSFDIYLGIAAREQNNIKLARKYFSDSLKIKETEMARICLAETFAIEKKYAEAEKHYLLGLKVVPQSMRALTGLAWTYFNDKNRETALEYFKKACSYDKKVSAEIRTAVKNLLEEKAEISQKYIEQAQRCNETYTDL